MKKNKSKIFIKNLNNNPKKKPTSTEKADSKTISKIFSKLIKFAKKKHNNISQEEIAEELKKNKLDQSFDIENKIMDMLEKESILVKKTYEEASKITADEINEKLKFDHNSQLLLNAKKVFDVRGRIGTSNTNKRILISDSNKFLLSTIGKNSILSEENERKLILMLNSKNPFIKKIAVDRLVNCNLRLVFSIANKYNNRGLEITDLFNEGVIGLYRAISKFDSTKFDNRFSTYATWWIRQSITRSISEQTRLIRLPVHMVDSINLIYKKEREFLQKNAILPNSQELADEIYKTKLNIFYKKMLSKMGFVENKNNPNLREQIIERIDLIKTPNKSHIILSIDKKHTKFLKENKLIFPTQAIKFKVFKVKDIEKLRQYSQDIISLEKPISEDDDSVFSDFISDTTISTPEETTKLNILKDHLYKLMNNYLTEKERDILSMKIGLSPYSKEYSLDEISQKFNITRERIRQICNKCLNKLSHPKLKKQIQDFFYDD